MASMDDRALGLSGIIAEIKGIIVDAFALPLAPQSIPDGVRIFEGGLGLNSLQGIELMVQIEDRFGVRINNLDWSVHEAQTLEGLAGYVMELAGKGG